MEIGVRQMEVAGKAGKSGGSLAFWFIVISGSLLIGLVFSMFCRMEVRLYLDEAMLEEKLKVIAGTTIISENLTSCIADLVFLNDLLQLKKPDNLFLISNDETGQVRNLSEEYQAFSLQRGSYDQVKIISLDGSEVVKIANEAGNIRIVSSQEFQDKQEQYDYLETIRLNKGEVYLSPWDANYEKSDKPVVRIGMPIFSRTNEKIGAIMIYYRGDIILSKFKDVTDDRFRAAMLLNSEGYWLTSLEPEFIVPDKQNQTFAKWNPEVWEIIKNKESGQVDNKDGLYTFTTVYPFKTQNLYGRSQTVTNTASIDTYYWKAVAYIPAEVLNSKIAALVSQYMVMFGIAESLVAAMGFLYLHLRTRQTFLSNQAEEALRKSEKLAVAGQLAAGVAHEVRNPLTVIKGAIQWMLAKKVWNQSLHELMLSEIERIEGVINEFLMLAKPQIPRFTKLSIGELTRNIIVLVQTQAVWNSITISTEIQDQLPDIFGDENQLKQVFINVLQNSIEAMPAGGHINIQITRSGADKIYIHFTDNGQGISQERIKTLFEPFYTTKEKGTGLGLAIVYNIISNHGGNIKVQSVIGQGTTFSIELPV